MTSSPRVSESPQRFLLLGRESLLSRCAEELLARGHEILGVVARGGAAADFARRHGLPLFEDPHDVELSGIEWILSITWLEIIPDELLAQASRGALNFHDGPLPRHAGLLAPTWALLEGERQHGIAWHTMLPTVDAGDVHVRRGFELADDDSTFTLNARCFEAGYDGFLELLGHIESGSLPSEEQDLSQRSLHLRSKQPWAAGHLDWRKSAAECARLFRALDFGPSRNELGKAWFRLDDDALYPVAVEVHERSHGMPAGTVLETDEEGFDVACGSGVLRMVGFTTPYGVSLKDKRGCPMRRLLPGDSLSVPSDAEAQSYESAARELRKHEEFWKTRLLSLEMAQLPWAPDRTLPAHRRELQLPEGRELRCAAFLAALGRLGGSERFHVGKAVSARSPEASILSETQVPMECQLDVHKTGAEFVAAIEEELAELERRGSWRPDAWMRDPELRDRVIPEALRPNVLIVEEAPRNPIPLAFVLPASGPATLSCDHGIATRSEFEAFARLVERYAQSLATQPEAALLSVALIEESELQTMQQRNQASFGPIEGPLNIPELLAARIARHPERKALSCREESISYAEFGTRIDTLARALRKLGIGPGKLVAVHLPRSFELVIAAHAIQRAGGAYLPLDPEYPAERLAFMLEDSGCELVLSSSHSRSQLPRSEGREQLELDTDAERIRELGEAEAQDTPLPWPAPDELAYVIYTSGSTGKPKGVQIEHRSAVNFFVGMDERLGVPAPEETKVWLAVTSLSFDISVLELFWTLTRGFSVVLYGGMTLQDQARPMGMSLAYFASDAGENPQDKYRLLREGARFADQHGFEAVWTPERHFHAFGGLYPNPSVVSAALAAWTERVHLRAGSVVTGLHHPIRVAEEWAVLDNLSNGRIGIALASGWHPNDFVLAPHRYEGRKERMLQDLDTLRRLWGREEVVFENPIQEELSVRILPEPLSEELPIWITAAGNPETFRMAGEKGCHVLTHLLGQSVEELEDKLRIYREAFAKSDYATQHGLTGKVTLLLHTYVTSDEQQAIANAREPMHRYLGSAADLIKKHVSSWSAVRTSLDQGDDEELDLEKLPSEDVQALLDYAFERYARSSALFGSPESCMTMIERLRDLGVDEIACLIDFGVPTEEALAALPQLDRLRQMMNAGATREAARESIEELILQHGVTHLQCTPSMATMLAADENTWPALAQLEQMLVGGEAVPPELARSLGMRLTQGRLIDVYGPTETTIWSSTAELAKDLEQVPIGTPIRNTSFWLLDPLALAAGTMHPVPDGVPGELWIGGDGLSRGYLGREELTAERFVADPFGGQTMLGSAPRIYRTGDLVRLQRGGDFAYLGRTDHQVKIRGYRIELGEIESVLVEHPSVGLAAVVIEDLGDSDQRMVAFVSPAPGSTPQTDALRRHLRDRLPEYMVPSDFVVLPELPRTPNGKLDRKRLERPKLAPRAVEQQAAPGAAAPPHSDPNAVPRGTDSASSTSSPADSTSPASPGPAAPAHASSGDPSETRELLRKIWSELLGREIVDEEANFFDLGGHSLLTIKVQARLAKERDLRLPLVDLFRFPTLRGLAEHVHGKLQPVAAPAGAATAASPPTENPRLAARRSRRR
jgi:natural product biosynthesis luciferase-like monooxygenase protein